MAIDASVSGRSSSAALVIAAFTIVRSSAAGSGETRPFEAPAGDAAAAGAAAIALASAARLAASDAGRPSADASVRR